MMILSKLTYFFNAILLHTYMSCTFVVYKTETTTHSRHPLCLTTRKYNNMYHVISCTSYEIALIDIIIISILCIACHLDY